MVCESLFQKIESLIPEYLPIWEQLGNIESPSSYKPGVDAVGNLFADMAQARGWKAAVMRGPGAGAPQPGGVPATPPEWTVSRLNAQGRRPVLRRESDVQEQLLILGGLSWASGPPERWAAAGQGALL